MGNRQSPMKVKMFMANVREHKKNQKRPAYDAPVVRHDPKYKPTRSEQIRIELSRRARMTPEARAMREGFIPLRSVRLG
jgi:hypothetical protein